MEQLRWEYKIALLFAAISAALMIVLFGEWLYAKYKRDKILLAINSPVAADYRVEPLPAFNFLPYPVDHYVEMVNRPLFVEGRKPLEISDSAAEGGAGGVNGVEAAAQEVGEFKLQLTGSMDTPEGVVALFEDPAAKEPKDKFKHFGVDEEHLGWKIVGIEPDRVIISSGGNQKEIMLHKSSPKAIPGNDPKQRQSTDPRSSQPGANGQNLSVEERRKKMEERRKRLEERRKRRLEQRQNQTR